VRTYWRALLAVAVVAAIWSPLMLYGASSVTMDGPMTDSNAALGQATTKNFTLNADDRNIDVLAVQTTFSSGTYGSPSFNDGRASTATITVTS